ncbi:MAG: NAD(P)/FAD-dependent oxidoreductase [Candidatus Methylomirabilales bacterium]
MTTRYLLLGNGIAGISAAQEIRRLDPAGQVTIVSDEDALGYSRVMLPLYIAGKRSRGALVFAPRAFYAAHGIRLVQRQAAEAVDTTAQRVRLASGRVLPYDRLLVATGSSPRTLDVPGKELAGVVTLRKLADARAIKARLRSSPGPVVIVGAGPVGVKSLEALAGKGREVHLVVSSDRILSQVLDRTASDFFLRAFQRRGVHVHLRTDVLAFHGRDGEVEAVSLSDGARLPCGLALIGKGVEPNVACLRDSGLVLRQGVQVDEHMATGVPGVYAAGDVAEPPDAPRGAHAPSTIWPSAAEGGRIAGANMAGVPARFSGALRMNAAEVLGVRVVSAGEPDGGQTLSRIRPEAPLYRKLVHADGRLAGYLLLGDIRGAGVLTALVKSRTAVSAALLERELERGVSYRPRLAATSGAARAATCGGTGN